MTTSLKAHYDGRVIIPDEPVDLPVNTPLELQLSPAAKEPNERDLQEARRRLARATGFLKHPPPPPEALRRESIYDESI